MASTFSTSGNHLDRKSLKRADVFTSTVSSLFSGLSKQSGVLVAVIGGTLGVGVLIAIFMSRADARSESARNALFLAEQSLESEMKTLAAQSPQVSQVKLTQSKENQAPSVAFKKLDVDKTFSETVKKLTSLESEFKNTRPAFEARLKLGELYFNHGEYSKALPWYEKAVSTAPNSFEKTVALSSLGYTHENLGKIGDALQTYQKALNLGEGSFKGDLLLGVARSYEAMHDLANARSTYDKILSELPNTEYAKSASVFKDQL